VKGEGTATVTAEASHAYVRYRRNQSVVTASTS
jgi:hypothetical protein